jgi:hypothetical protein
MRDRKGRLAKLLSIPVLAVCGFTVAATMAGVGLATVSTSTSTPSTTTVPPTTVPTTTTVPTPTTVPTTTTTTTAPPPPPTGFCHETVNPAGNPGVGDNGHPDDPFGGDAVPGGKSTSPGTRGNGPINSDGFYLVGGPLFSDETPIEFPEGGFVWPDNTTIKYTERGNPEIDIKPIGGPNSVIQYHVQAPGDLYANAPQGDPAAVFCGVPPPPF